MRKVLRAGRSGDRADVRAIVRQYEYADEVLASGRGFKSFGALKTYLGPAGEGKVWHHVVEKRAANVKRFGAERIHNTMNAVPVPRQVNQALANYYSTVQPFTKGQTVRQWLGSQSWRQQFEYGQKTLQKALSGQPLP